MDAESPNPISQRVRDLRKQQKVIVVSPPKEQEWQCIECGTVVESTTRPGHCPHCNMQDSDYDVGVRAMAPREVVGWFP